MIVVGLKEVSGDIKVASMFTDDSSVVSITATDPPNKPEQQDGKDDVLYLNVATNELYWLAVDRPLTDAEKVTELEAQNAQMLLALVTGGLM